MVARHVIAAREVLPRAASASRCSCSCKSTTRAIQVRHGRSPPIWSPSIPYSAAGREPQPQSLRPPLSAHRARRCDRRCRCRDDRSQEARDGCRIDLPDGQISGVLVILPVQPHLQKYSASPFARNSIIDSLIPPHTEGRCATSSTRSGMRWTRAALETRAPIRGRQRRVVLTPRRRRQVCEKKRRRR